MGGLIVQSLYNPSSSMDIEQASWTKENWIQEIKTKNFVTGYPCLIWGHLTWIINKLIIIINLLLLKPLQ